MDECWGVRKRTSTLGHLLDSTKVLAPGRLKESTDHGHQGRTDVLRSSFSALLKPVLDLVC